MSAWRGSAHSQPTKKDFISFLIKTMNNFRVDQSGTLSWEFAGVAQDITKTNYEGWNIEAVRETYFMLKLQSLWCSAGPGDGNEDGDGIFRTWACTGGGRWGEGTELACRLTLLPWLAVPTGIYL